MKSLRNILAISLVLLSFSVFTLTSKAENDPIPSCKLAAAGVVPCLGEDNITVMNTLAERQANERAAITAAETAATNAKRGVKVCPDSAYTSGGLLSAVAFMPALCSIADFTLGAIGGMLAGIMYLCATLFDYSVDKFILKISLLFLDSASTVTGGNKAYIYNTWATVRDLANIMAFFAAVYAGFLRIIGQNQEDFRKAVAKLVLFALLTNFSFALSKAAIDLTNVVSLQFYGAAAGYKFADNIGTSDKGYVVSDYGISTAFAQNMGLSSFVADTSKVNPQSAFASLDSVTVVFVSYIFFIFVGWQFLAMAIFILARSFMLIVSVVFSPFMFIGGLVPPLTKLHDKWREMFFGNLVVAPIIMLFIWLSLTVLTALQTAFKTAPLAATTPVQTMLQQIALLTIAGLSLHFGKKYAEQFSGAAGQFAVKVLGGVIGGAAMAVGTGGAGFVVRAGAARAAGLASGVGKRWVEQEGAGKFRKFAGGMLLKGGERMEKTEIFGKSAYGIRKQNEEKVTAARNLVLQEHGEAAKVGGWKDKLGQAKSEKELSYIKDQLAQGKKYDPAVHDAEMANLNKVTAKSEIKPDTPRVLEKDKTIANKLHEQITARDTAIDAQIKTEQDQLDAEYAGPLKTRLNALENLKLSKADPKEIENAQKFIDNLNKTLTEKKTAVADRLHKQKEEMVDYVGWKAELSGLEGEFSKTTMMYKAGAAIGSLNERERQAGEKEMAALKGAVTNLPQKLGDAFSKATGDAFKTEYDKPNLKPGATTLTDIRDVSELNPVDKSIKRNADKTNKANMLRSKKTT